MLTVFLQAAPAQSMTPTLLMIGLMFVGFYFLMIRPQMKKQKQEKTFQEALKPGAKVVTTSGMHGTIFSINEDGVVLETLSGKLKFEKAAISRDFTIARFPETFGVEKKKLIMPLNIIYRFQSTMTLPTPSTKIFGEEQMNVEF